MNIQFILAGTLFLVVGAILMMKHHFYKYKSDDMLFATKMKVFLGSAILALSGVLILVNELKKILS